VSTDIDAMSNIDTSNITPELLIRLTETNEIRGIRVAKKTSCYISIGFSSGIRRDGIFSDIRH